MGQRYNIIFTKCFKHIFSKGFKQRHGIKFKISNLIEGKVKGFSNGLSGGELNKSIIRADHFSFKHKFRSREIDIIITTKSEVIKSLCEEWEVAAFKLKYRFFIFGAL